MAEPFNLKVREFQGGVVEIRKYSQVLCGAEFVDMSKEEIQQIKNETRERNSKNLEKKIVFNPFSEQYEEMHEFWQVEQLERNRKHSISVSTNRTKNAIYDISRQCVWDYFITLTFDKAKVDRYNFDECMKKANNWFKNQKKRFSPNLKYIFVPEQHEDGAWHIHGLLCDCGCMVFVDSGKRYRKQIIYNLGGWRFGWSTATKVRSSDRVSSYITKYISKSLCDVTKGKKRYYFSRNIPKVKETTLLSENKDFDIDVIVSSLGVDLEYSKEVTGYIDVEYKYYK